jgi:hypothetical protein
MHLDSQIDQMLHAEPQNRAQDGTSILKRVNIAVTPNFNNFKASQGNKALALINALVLTAIAPRGRGASSREELAPA